jgi:glutamate-5-semialdehyde dehydrogenase
MAGLRRTAGLPPLPLASGTKPSPAKGKDGAGGKRAFDSALAEQMQAIGVAARAAARQLATTNSADKSKALRQAAAAIRAGKDDILAANRRDIEAAQQHELTAAMRDRLLLDDKRVEVMARGLEDVAALPEPVGRMLASWTQPNGLRFERISVPLGVIGIIYESRPNVTADAGALCLKAGNAAILRGGSESFHSSAAIAACLHQGLAAAGLPAAAIQLVPTRDRQAVGLMLGMAEHIDVIVPRGGKSLIARVQRESRIPVLAHLDGNCHVYVDGAADPAKARAVVLNAKMRRTGVCGAAETLLVDRKKAARLLPPILADLHEAGCALRGDEATRALDPAVGPATEADWTTEYLDAILAVRIVDGVDGAIAHINRYGSHHTDAIVSEDKAAAERFVAEVDSAIVLVNASTQFADGGEFGMGAEIGISTGRLHARGPVGAEQLTTYKYVVRGDGQVRP